MSKPTRGPSPYVPVDGDKDRFNPLPGQAFPPLHLVEYNRGLYLREDRTGLIVGPSDRRLPKIGIFVVDVRGTFYHQEAVKAADTRPGKAVHLLREPDNPHDQNAIAVAMSPGGRTIGYVNKQKARWMAKVLDTGAPLEAITTRGFAPGEWTEGSRPAFLAASPVLLAYLRGSTSRRG